MCQRVHGAWTEDAGLALIVVIISYVALRQSLQKSHLWLKDRRFCWRFSLCL